MKQNNMKIKTNHLQMIIIFLHNKYMKKKVNIIRNSY